MNKARFLKAGLAILVLAVFVAAAAPALLGAGIAALTRRPAWYGSLRQVVLGGIAAAVTYIRHAWSNRARAVTPEMVQTLRGK